jgi:hypothetical protein
MTTPAKQTPRPEQSYRIERILTEPTKAALLADDMGVGKTLVGSEVAVAFQRALVIGLKDTFEQWRDRMAAQSGGAVTLRRIDGTKAGKQAAADMRAGLPGHYFANIQTLSVPDWKYEPAFEVDQFGNPTDVPIWHRKKTTGEFYCKKPGVPRERLFSSIEEAQAEGFAPVQESMRTHVFHYRRMKPLDVIVFDEVHAIANRKSIGGRTLRTIKSEYKVGMSGTFTGNQFPNAWTIARWLWPELIEGNFDRWKRENCALDTVYVAGGKEQEVVAGERIPGRFVNSLPCYIRKEADEKAPEPKIVYVELTDAQRWQYEQLERDLMVWLETHRTKGGREPLIADLPITLRQRLRTATLGEMILDENGEVDFAAACKSSKLVALRGLLDHYEAQHPGMPVGIYVNSKKFAKVAVRRLQMAGYNAELWSGDVSTKGRAELKRRFLAGEIQYLVSTISSFSTGLDGFQTMCSKVVWLEQSENQMANAQAIARYFRPGRTKEYGEFEQVMILANNTHDVGVYQSLALQAAARNAEMRAAA